MSVVGSSSLLLSLFIIVACAVQEAQRQNRAEREEQHRDGGKCSPTVDDRPLLSRSCQTREIMYPPNPKRTT